MKKNKNYVFSFLDLHAIDDGKPFPCAKIIFVLLQFAAVKKWWCDCTYMGSAATATLRQEEGPCGDQS